MPGGAVVDEDALGERARYGSSRRAARSGCARGGSIGASGYRRASAITTLTIAKIYTRAGDDGTTGLYFGGRVAKRRRADRASTARSTRRRRRSGWRARCGEPGGALDELLISVERDLWVLMAEVATAPSNRHKLVGGKTLVTAGDGRRASRPRSTRCRAEIELPKEFVVPGENRLAAALDVARTVVRRAERVAVGYALAEARWSSPT